MRIALDYTAGASHWPGVGRYGRELVRALVRREDCPELVLFEHGRDPALPAAALGLEGQVASDRVTRVRLGASRRLVALGARLGGLVGSHGLGGVGPVDLVHHALPGMLPARGRQPHTAPLFELSVAPPGSAALAADERTARSLAGMTRVVCGSVAGAFQAARRLEPFGLDPWRLRAVTTGADHWLRDAEPLAVDVLQALGPPRVLALGAVARQRRTVELAAGFERLCDRLPAGERPELVLVGRSGDAADDLRAWLASSPVADRVTWIADPVEGDLPALVAGTTLLAHLSAGELSPITPLEALHFGAAVVASDLPAFEVELDAEQRLAPEVEQDPERLADELARGLERGLDAEARAVRRGLASFHSWDACAEDHLRVWHEAVVDPELELEDGA